MPVSTVTERRQSTCCAAEKRPEGANPSGFTVRGRSFAGRICLKAQVVALPFGPVANGLDVLRRFIGVVVSDITQGPGLRKTSFSTGRPVETHDPLVTFKRSLALKRPLRLADFLLPFRQFGAPLFGFRLGVRLLADALRLHGTSGKRSDNGNSCNHCWVTHFRAPYPVRN